PIGLKFFQRVILTLTVAVIIAVRNADPLFPLQIAKRARKVARDWPEPLAQIVCTGQRFAFVEKVQNICIIKYFMQFGISECVPAICGIYVMNHVVDHIFELFAIEVEAFMHGIYLSGVA